MSTSRRQVREAAFLLSFEKLFRDDPLDVIFESAKEVDDFDFNDEAKQLVRNICDNADKLDEIIAEFSDKRAVSRIPKVNLALLRLAIYESMFDERVPVNVAISEAVKLAQAYALDSDVSFVNGVLGSFSKSEHVKDKAEDTQ
ncbi:MAG: transcription antitermination factor NusB [Ruminococcus sp.]|nr:transcription antitermination factor NusB [Ruminococcus sp.]